MNPIYYGTMVKYEFWKIIHFPDFTLEFLWNEEW